MDHWVEAADWIVWQLCGTYVRNACAAGYKGILQDGAHPSEEFLAALDPGFAGFVTDKLEQPIGQLGQRAGGLTAEAAAWTGLPEGIAVAVGNVDMTADQLVANVMLAINYLVSLLKKGWQNVGSLTIKASMSPPKRLY